MTDIKNILRNHSHRPYDLPEGSWKYYQEWNDVLFLHWEIPFDQLRSIVPFDLQLDNFEGRFYISLVGFTMQKIRPRYLPSFSLISDFHEINIRTYVDVDGKKGVYFLNIEAAKAISSIVARSLSGLPYRKSRIMRMGGRYASESRRRGSEFSVDVLIGSDRAQKSELELWLTERYCLYSFHKGKYFRYDVHHEEWNLKDVRLMNLTCSYKISELPIIDTLPQLAHYSKGVNVVSWDRIML